VYGTGKCHVCTWASTQVYLCVNGWLLPPAPMMACMSSVTPPSVDKLMSSSGYWVSMACSVPTSPERQAPATPSTSVWREDIANWGLENGILQGYTKTMYCQIRLSFRSTLVHIEWAISFIPYDVIKFWALCVISSPGPPPWSWGPASFCRPLVGPMSC